MTELRRARSLVDVADDIHRFAATLVVSAEQHIDMEIRAWDGSPAAQSFRHGSPGTDTTSTTERHMIKRDELASVAVTIGADRDLIIATFQHLTATCRRAIGTRLKIEGPTCTSDAHLAGYLVPLDDGGWFDPLCNRPSRSAVGGQCDACRKRLERWRARNDRPELADERQVTYESTVVDGKLGVVHARPRSAA